MKHIHLKITDEQFDYMKKIMVNSNPCMEWKDFLLESVKSFEALKAFEEKNKSLKL